MLVESHKAHNGPDGGKYEPVLEQRHCEYCEYGSALGDDVDDVDN